MPDMDYFEAWFKLRQLRREIGEVAEMGYADAAVYVETAWNGAQSARSSLPQVQREYGHEEAQSCAALVPCLDVEAWAGHLRLWRIGSDPAVPMPSAPQASHNQLRAVDAHSAIYGMHERCPIDLMPLTSVTQLLQIAQAGTSAAAAASRETERLKMAVAERWDSLHDTLAAVVEVADARLDELRRPQPQPVPTTAPVPAAAAHYQGFGQVQQVPASAQTQTQPVAAPSASTAPAASAPPAPSSPFASAAASVSEGTADGGDDEEW